MRRPHTDQRPYALGRGLPWIPRGRQLAIMTILWKRGPLPAATIQDELAELEEPDIARQTVLTYLATLRRYGWVRARPVGGRFWYDPTFPISLARTVTIDFAVDRLYDGARENLLIDVIESRSTPSAVLPRVRAALERRLAAITPPTSAPAESRARGGPPSGRSAASSPGSRRPSP